MPISKWVDQKTHEQNRTRNIEIKNKLTVTRGAGRGGKQRKEGEGPSRNMIKGPRDKDNNRLGRTE